MTVRRKPYLPKILARSKATGSVFSNWLKGRKKKSSGGVYGTNKGRKVKLNF